MNPLKLFITPRFFSPDDLHAYRKAQLLNFLLLFGLVMLFRSTIRNFIYMGDNVELVVGIVWCVVIALAYYQFKVKYRLGFPSWVGSMSLAWVIGDLAYHNPVLAAPLLLLVPLISFSLIGIVWGSVLSVSFSIFIIGNLALNTPEVGAGTPNAFIYNHVMALLLGGGAACYLEVGKKKVINKLRDSATKDELTRCWNRYIFLQSLDSEILGAQRLNTTFTLAIFDLDHFKKVNDKYGHTAGDVVLKEFAALINESIRKTDTLARWGGEEFVLLLPSTSANEATNICEGIRHKVRTNQFSFGDLVTTSVGLTAYESNISTKDLIRRADSALYEAKRQGRDCSRAWQAALETE